jgi:hypothetical protein
MNTISLHGLLACRSLCSSTHSLMLQDNMEPRYLNSPTAANLLCPIKSHNKGKSLHTQSWWYPHLENHQTLTIQEMNHRVPFSILHHAIFHN